MEATREFRPASVVPIAILAVALVASTGCASLGPKAKTGAVLGSTGGGLIAIASGGLSTSSGVSRMAKKRYKCWRKIWVKGISWRCCKTYQYVL
jgi:hypothetical protein